jgi:redox-sensitive bicupin YhaK (pirin superfamily)
MFDKQPARCKYLFKRSRRISRGEPVHKCATMGAADHGWLKAKHHFSFGSHYDPDNMGHGSLRVWNDDEIAPNTGFPAHPHANMEIIT